MGFDANVTIPVRDIVSKYKEQAGLYNVINSMTFRVSAESIENEYGITLISLNEDYRKKTEPGAASYADRLAALKALHNAGCKTWVSIEPYPTPNLINQNLGEILEAVGFTDRIIFGRTNYNKTVSAYKENKRFYNECAEEVIAFCEERSINCHIKAKTQTKE